MNTLLFRLKAIFPAWSAATKGDGDLEKQVRREWLAGLIENNIDSMEKIERGLARCRAHRSPFLPSVGEFASWCTESSGDFPEAEEARRLLNAELAKSFIDRDWGALHPAIWWVYSQKTSSDWKSISDEKQAKAFGFLWAEARKLAAKNFVFQAPLPRKQQIPVAPEVPAPAAVAERHITALMSEFKGPENAPNEKLFAPWSSQQLRTLKNKQFGAAPILHCDSPLRVTELGLACCKCDFKRNWFIESEL